jgi:hypothetical protein
MTWTEQEYCAYLEAERRRYAWVLHRFGDVTPEQAEAAAAEFYYYEPGDDPLRGLVFHDEAWHWALRGILGDNYPNEHPDLVAPPPEYDALD